MRYKIEKLVLLSALQNTYILPKYCKILREIAKEAMVGKLEENSCSSDTNINGNRLPLMRHSNLYDWCE